MTKLFDIKFEAQEGHYFICTYIDRDGNYFWEPAATFWIKRRLPFPSLDIPLDELLIMEGWEPPSNEH